MARRPKVTTTETTNTEEASGEQPAKTSKIEWPKVLVCPFPNCGARTWAQAATDLKPGVKACVKCGAGLTPMNRADDQTTAGGIHVDTPIQNAPKSTPRSSRDVAAPNPEDVGETVSATWGEELYTPQQFFSFRVGPFTRSTKIREGETAIDAKRRIFAEMKQMADDERAEKLRIFLDTVAYLFKTVKGEKS